MVEGMDVQEDRDKIRRVEEEKEVGRIVRDFKDSITFGTSGRDRRPGNQPWRALTLGRSLHTKVKLTKRRANPYDNKTELSVRVTSTLMFGMEK